MAGQVDVRGCPGYRALHRRRVLRAGVCGALGLSLHDLIRGESRAATTGQAAAQTTAKALSVIQINLPGGLPQQESFDPKPESPIAYRGPFGVVKTKTGEIFSDNLPKLAAIADKFTVVRSVVGRIPDHGQATYHLFTGYTPTAVIDYPQMGAVVSHELGPRGELPPYVAVPGSPQFAGGTGFLGSMYGAFELGGDPGKDRNFKASDCTLPPTLPPERLRQRLSGRAAVEEKIRKMEADRGTLDTMDEFYERAFTILTSSKAQAAFSLDGETEATFDRYGHGVAAGLAGNGKPQPAGLAGRLILARRLVEAGVRFVTVEYGKWDSHVDVKKNCADQLPALDQGLAGLIDDLEDRGLLDTTLVMLTTEFGRTPKVNGTSGRDHWARVYSMMLAGGGAARGTIHGASDATAAEPARDAVPLEDFLCTVYHLLGIDADKELVAFGTRPIEIIKDGKVVRGLLA